MGIVLFRQGDQHEYQGIKCERGIFDALELDARLKEGWTADIKEIEKYAKKPDQKEEPEPEGIPGANARSERVRENGEETDKKEKVLRKKRG